MLTLYDYQVRSAEVVESALRKHGFALDASDTGTGKTYVACEVARRLGLPFVVICPKSIRTAWTRVARQAGIEPLDVLNVEKLKAGTTPWLSRRGRNQWQWSLPPGSLIIWDEVHNAGGIRTQNSKILALTKAYRYPVLAISATSAESPLKMRALGYLLGLHSYRDFWTWVRSNGCFENKWGGFQFLRGPRGQAAIKRIHSHVFPEYGTRVIIDETDAFPENSIQAEAYDLDEYTSAINKIYTEMDEALRDPEKADTHLTVMLRARQQVELYKTPLLAEMTMDLLEEGKSVVVFVNFRDTLEQLQQRLGSDIKMSVIFGGQSTTVRDSNVDLFQADHTRVCLTMVQAGGQSISLDDRTGKHPRVSLVCPGFNAVELSQALGRIHRAGTKTKCVQKIVFAADTIEERACAAVKRKLDNISLLNDGDLQQGVVFHENTDK